MSFTGRYKACHTATQRVALTTAETKGLKDLQKVLGWQRVTLPKLKLLLNSPHTLRIYSVNVPLLQVLLHKFLFIRPQGGPSVAGLSLLIRDNSCRIMTSWHNLCHIYIKATPLQPLCHKQVDSNNLCHKQVDLKSYYTCTQHWFMPLGKNIRLNE